jgi:hypothetical protein
MRILRQDSLQVRQIRKICIIFLRYSTLLLIISTLITCGKKENEGFTFLKKNFNIVERKVWDIVKYDSGVSRVFNLAYEHRNDSSFQKLCLELNDSILASDNDFMISSIISGFYGSTFDTIDWVFQEDRISGACFGDHKMLNICLENEKSIYIHHKPGNVSMIKDTAIDYIYDPGNKYKFPEKKKKVVKYFGEVELPRVPIFFVTHLKKKKGLNVNEWKLFFACLHEIIELFHEKMNQLAMEKWNMSYNSLPAEKKSVLLQVASIGILIVF